MRRFTFTPGSIASLGAAVALLVAAFAFGWSAPARAQDAAQVVATCGVPNQGSLPVGIVSPITQDSTGTLCTKGGGGAAVQPIAGADGSTKASTSNPLPVSFDGQSAPSGTNVGYSTTTTVFSVSEVGMAQVNFFLSTTASLGYAFEGTSDPTCTTGWASANVTNGANTYNGGTFTGGFGFTHYANEACFRVRVSSAAGGTGTAWWQGVRAPTPVISSTGISGVSATGTGFTVASNGITGSANMMGVWALGAAVDNVGNARRVGTLAGVLAGNGDPVGVDEVGRSYSHISTAATTTVKSGAGYLHALNVNTCVANATVTLYDNISGNGTVIGVATCPATVGNPISLTEDVKFSTGLTIVTSAATDLTVSYF